MKRNWTEVHQQALEELNQKFDEAGGDIDIDVVVNEIAENSGLEKDDMEWVVENSKYPI